MVIGIIALLISILLPSLNSVRRSANTVKCLSNERQFGNAVAFFINDHKSYMPKAWLNYDAGAGGEKWGFESPLHGSDSVLYNYSDKSPDVFKCPSDPTDIMRSLWNDGRGKDGTGVDYLFTNSELMEDDLASSYRWTLSNNCIPRDPRVTDQFPYIITDPVDTTESLVLCDMKADPWREVKIWNAKRSSQPSLHHHYGFAKPSTQNVLRRRAMALHVRYCYPSDTSNSGLH